MIIINGLSEIEYDGNTIVAIGKFDGIHEGHQKLISYMTSRKNELKSVVFTFSYASEIFLKKDERILSDDERREKFKKLGVDYLVEYDLNEVTSKMEPEDFVGEILVKRLHAKEIVCGPDLSFGYKGRGNVDLLNSLSSKLGLKVNIIDKVKYLGEDISSTRIREALALGNIFDANKMLRG